MLSTEEASNRALDERSQQEGGQAPGSAAVLSDDCERASGQSTCRDAFSLESRSQGSASGEGRAKPVLAAASSGGTHPTTASKRLWAEQARRRDARFLLARTLTQTKRCCIRKARKIRFPAGHPTAASKRLWAERARRRDARFLLARTSAAYK